MMPPLLIAFFILTIIKYGAQHFKIRLKLGGIPGPKGLPLFGNVFQFIGGGKAGVLKVLTQFCSEFGSRFQMWLGLNPYLIISNAKDIERVLSSQQHIEKSLDYNFLVPWLGRGLLTSSGSLWHARRKMLTPAFHFAILEEFLTIMCEQGDILVDVLDGLKGREFDLFPVVTRAALDIICETAMGKKIHAQRETDSEYVKAVYRISDLVQHRQFRPWLHPDIIWRWSPSGREEYRTLKILHEFTDSVIQKRKKMRTDKTKAKAITPTTTTTEADPTTPTKTKSNKSKKSAFLDLLLDAQQQQQASNLVGSVSLTDLDIRAEVDTFMFEGHDTTAANINWTLYLLGRHPAIQRKVQEEIDSILEGNPNKGKISSGDLSKMKYLECCIKESLRIYPSVPFIGRKLAGELTLDDRTVIPQETAVMVLIFHANRDPSVFPDPELFKPERFQDIEKSPYSYVPFSAGPRNCIGQKFAIMEEKVILAKVLQKYKITSVQKPEDITLLAELILRPQDGIRVRLESRE